jgi:hypothetical protein
LDKRASQIASSKAILDARAESIEMIDKGRSKELLWDHEDK